MLTAKQEAFACAIAQGYNQAEAYRRAYNAGTMGPATVDVKASVLVRHDKIAVRIRELREAAAIPLLLTKAHWLQSMAEVAYGVLPDVAPWDEDGIKLIPSAELSHAQQSLVKSIEVKRERPWRGKGDDAEQWEVEHVKITLNDQLRARELLARGMGWLSADEGQGTTVNIDARQQTVQALSLDELVQLAREGQG